MSSILPAPSATLTDAVLQLQDRLRSTDSPDAAYTPALSVVRSKSNGYTYRVPGIKTGRQHHLLSKLEYHTFLFFDFSSCLNIREQFPLPLALTVLLAAMMGIKHPRDRKNLLVEMTTDFVVSTAPGKWLAIDVKPSNRLASKRTQEKLNLVCRAWSLLQVDHKLITERQHSETVINNYRFLHTLALPFDPPPVSECEMTFISEQMKARLVDGGTTLRDAARGCEKQTNIHMGRCIRTAYWLIAQKRWAVDFTHPIGADHSVIFLN